MVKGLILFMMLAMLVDPGDIGKINSLKSEAKEAYNKGDFQTAISKYRFLIDSLGVTEDEVQLNMANSYFQAHDTTYTANSYQPVTQSSNTKLRSIAHQQLGVLANQQNKYEEALANFKQALKADPTNEDARYNYEMVKKKLEEQKKKEEEQKKNDPNQKEENKDKKDQNKEEKKDQNKDQKQDQKEKQDQENKEKQEQQDKEKKEQDKKDKEKQDQQKEDEQEKENKEKKDLPPSVSEKLKEMEMSEEKAKMILEAMKNQEIQYLQQNKRKATKPKDKGKPDW